MFNTIDPELEAWASDRSLTWSRLHRDDEVRSIQFTLPDGRTGQIWLEQDGANWLVHAWNGYKGRWVGSGVPGALSAILSAALERMRQWGWAGR